MNTLNWRRVDSGGVRERRHTVYWVAQCGAARLTVARIYNEDGSFTPGGPWRWTLRVRDNFTKREAIIREGDARSVQSGRRQVVEALFMRPSDG